MRSRKYVMAGEGLQVRALVSSDSRIRNLMVKLSLPPGFKASNITRTIHLDDSTQSQLVWDIIPSSGTGPGVYGLNITVYDVQGKRKAYTASQIVIKEPMVIVPIVEATIPSPYVVQDRAFWITGNTFAYALDRPLIWMATVAILFAAFMRYRRWRGKNYPWE